LLDEKWDISATGSERGYGELFAVRRRTTERRLEAMALSSQKVPILGLDLDTSSLKGIFRELFFKS